MAMVTVTQGSLEAPQGRFGVGQSVNLPPAEAARCVSLGVAVLASGVPQTQGVPQVWSRIENNQTNFPIGTVTFSSQPVTGSAITLNGTLITFVASGAVGNQISIAGSLAATLVALAAFLNASPDPNLSMAGYSVTGSVLNVFSAGILFIISASTSPASNATTQNAGP